MTDFTKYEVWEDHWCFKPSQPLYLMNFLKLNYTSYRNREEIQIRIETNANSTHPNEHQIKTFQFIKENQNEIINSVFDYYQKVILPVFQEATDIEQDEIALNTFELSKVLGVLAIEIPEKNISNSIHFLIQFDFRYDPEHGLYILFENTNPIDFFGEGDKSYDAIDLFHKDNSNTQTEPIRIHLFKVNGESVFNEAYTFDEIIKFELNKGTYSASVYLKKNELCRNFYIPKDLNEFTLREILTNK